MNTDLIWKVQLLPVQQKKVFLFLIHDIQSKEIGAKLGLSRQAITTYSKIIYKKFGVDSRYGLILSLASDSETLKALDKLQDMG